MLTFEWHVQLVEEDFINEISILFLAQLHSISEKGSSAVSRSQILAQRLAEHHSITRLNPAVVIGDNRTNSEALARVEADSIFVGDLNMQVTCRNIGICARLSQSALQQLRACPHAPTSVNAEGCIEVRAFG